MLHGPVALYVVGVGTAVAAIYATQAALPATAVILLAVLAPCIPVVIGYALTRRTLTAQNIKVQEIHVLVNSQLSNALQAAQNAILETIRLKAQTGEPLTMVEREVAATGTLPPTLADAAETVAHVDDLKTGELP